jgi:hypothetical protein
MKKPASSTKTATDSGISREERDHKRRAAEARKDGDHDLADLEDQWARIARWGVVG